ncbi:unnamed protein product [Macrosiphum euphorbiae]|uniref:Uncharacterized protein n=1 Tax=Macrosiphum euphorbiae TaxID=13131 RepID=A0AAV0XDX5_9HEMI|nr:unnamed protein product [Macrosiphum euphorbiae]
MIKIINELQLSIADSNKSNDALTVETIHISEADLNFDLLNQFELDTGEPPFEEESYAEYFSGYVENHFYKKIPFFNCST